MEIANPMILDHWEKDISEFCQKETSATLAGGKPFVDDES